MMAQLDAVSSRGTCCAGKMGVPETIATDAAEAAKQPWEPETLPHADAREIVTVGLVLVAIALAFQLHLRSVIISDMDEGTYLYAGRLIARGLVPYRDFLLAHPPLVALVAAGWFRAIDGSVASVRLAYLVLVLGGTLPLYALVRSIARSKLAALITIVTYMAGMLLLANMGRTVRLEPLMNAFVISAVAIRFLRPSSTAWMAAAGGLLAAAAFVKVIAVIPAVLFLVGDLIWDRPLVPLLKRWGAAAGGAAAVLAPSLGWCAAQPYFVRDVLLSQVNRPRIDLALRWHYLVQNASRFPPVALGLLAALFFLWKAKTPRVRILAFAALGNTITLAFAFKTFFGYYIVQALPWIACSFAMAVDAVGLRWLRGRWPAAANVVVAFFAVVVPLAYAEYYERTAASHVTEPAKILPLLARDGGYLYTMYPAFALWSERAIYPWYYQADSLVPRINHWIGDSEFIEAFGGSTALVFYTGELDDYPRARAFVQENFREEYRDADWAVWLRPEGRGPVTTRIPTASPPQAP